MVALKAPPGLDPGIMHGVYGTRNHHTFIAMFFDNKHIFDIRNTCMMPRNMLCAGHLGIIVFFATSKGYIMTVTATEQNLIQADTLSNLYSAIDAKYGEDFFSAIALVDAGILDRANWDAAKNEPGFNPVVFMNDDANWVKGGAFASDVQDTTADGEMLADFRTNEGWKTVALDAVLGRNAKHLKGELKKAGLDVDFTALDPTVQQQLLFIATTKGAQGAAKWLAGEKAKAPRTFDTAATVQGEFARLSARGRSVPSDAPTLAGVLGADPARGQLVAKGVPNGEPVTVAPLVAGADTARLPSGAGKLEYTATEGALKNAKLEGQTGQLIGKKDGKLHINENVYRAQIEALDEKIAALGVQAGDFAEFAPQNNGKGNYPDTETAFRELYSNLEQLEADLKRARAIAITERWHAKFDEASTKLFKDIADKTGDMLNALARIKTPLDEKAETLAKLDKQRGAGTLALSEVDKSAIQGDMKKAFSVKNKGVAAQDYMGDQRIPVAFAALLSSEDTAKTPALADIRDRLYDAIRLATPAARQSKWPKDTYNRPIPDANALRDYVEGRGSKLAEHDIFADYVAFMETSFKAKYGRLIFSNDKQNASTDDVRTAYRNAITKACMTADPKAIEAFFVLAEKPAEADAGKIALKEKPKGQDPAPDPTVVNALPLARDPHPELRDYLFDLENLFPEACAETRVIAGTN